MKMRHADFEALSASLATLADAHRDALLAHRAKVSEQRFLWDVLRASRFDTRALYSYLNDSHIETAMRAALRKVLP